MKETQLRKLTQMRAEISNTTKEVQKTIQDWLQHPENAPQLSDKDRDALELIWSEGDLSVVPHISAAEQALTSHKATLLSLKELFLPGEVAIKIDTLLQKIHDFETLQNQIFSQGMQLLANPEYRGMISREDVSILEAYASMTNLKELEPANGFRSNSANAYATYRASKEPQGRT